MTNKNYTTSARKKGIQKIIMILLLIGACAIWSAVAVESRKPDAWDVEYPIANQNIEWSGAGYSGIWGRR